MRLSEKLEAWAAHAELVASGLGPLRKQALAALAEGRPWQARQLAFDMLDAVPNSPLALAVWADAAQAMLLDNEACEALDRLASVVPYRADVWLRLAEVRATSGGDAKAALQRIEALNEPSEAVQQGLTRLLEDALDQQNVPRVIALAARLRTGAQQSGVQRARLAEAALTSGCPDEARRWLSSASPPELTDARGWLTLAHLLTTGAEQQKALKRALLLGDSLLVRKVADFVSEQPGCLALRELLPLAKELGVGESGEWQVARALACEQASDALSTLELQALKVPSTANRNRFLGAALSARDVRALERALELSRKDASTQRGPGLAREAQHLLRALGLAGSARLAALDSVHAEGRGWAQALRQDVYSSWLGAASADGITSLMSELEMLAKQWLDIDVLHQVASLRLDLERPLRVAVIGEFNAGKSSLINCIVGAPVAPVGVLPTTATVNRLCWSPDRFVQVEYTSAERAMRLLDYASLKGFLAEVDVSQIAQVTIFGPLKVLRSLEVIDTPGFNADRPEHEKHALAAVESAHVLLWVLDATGALRATDAKTVQRLRQVSLPTCVVVNKADRLGPEERTELVQHVNRGLESLAIELEAPVCMFSAARAQLVSETDTQALSESGWNELEGLLASLLARSPELKARALKERARSLVEQLQQGHPRQEPAYLAFSETASRMAQRLAARRLALEAEWAKRLREQAKQLANEVEALPRDQPEAAHYVATRAGQVLGPALFEQVSSELDEVLAGGLTEMLEARLHALARGLGVSLRQVPHREWAQLAAGLSHAEAMLLLREAAQKAPFESMRSARAESGADHAEASLQARLEGLSSAFAEYRSVTDPGGRANEAENSADAP